MSNNDNLQNADMQFLVADLQRTFMRVAGNLRWYEQEWLGVPIWQLPDDLIALQKIVFDHSPKWIVETGTKFGGSAIFFASILAMMGRQPNYGGVITVDIEETAEAKQFLRDQPHRLAPHVRSRLVGDAKSPEVIESIKKTIETDPGSVMVFLDDWHDGNHVYQEILAYSELVSLGGILIVADTTFEDLADTPIIRPSAKYPDPKRSNPRVALRRYLAESDLFEQVSEYTSRGITNVPDGVLRKVRLV